MAYNAGTGLVYIPAMEAAAEYSTAANFEYRPGKHWNLGQASAAMSPPFEDALIKGVMKRIPQGHLLAWDPVTQEAAWRVDHASMWNGGVLVLTCRTP